MKNKLVKIFGVSVTVAIVVSMLVAPIPASAGTLAFSSESLASSTSYGVASGTDVVDIAVAGDGVTAYAVTGASKATLSSTLFKSTNGGTSWTIVADNVTLFNIPSAFTPITQVTVAPDVADGSVVAIVAGNKVMISTNAGGTWADLTPVSDLTSGTIAATIKTVDLSKAIGSTRTIAVGGTNTLGAAGIWAFELGGVVGRWVDVTQTVTGGWNAASFGTANATEAIAFSPNFISDRTLVVVTSNASNNNVQLQVANFAAKAWNNNNYGSGWGTTGVNIVNAGGTVQAASIAMPAAYLGADSGSRTVFVGLATSDATGQLYRFIDTAKIAMLPAAAGVASVAYNSTAGKLVAGAYNTNNVYRSANPLASASAITVDSAASFKRPGEDTVDGVTNKIIVSFAGTNVVAGTSGADSCYSISKDDGKSFNDVSFIDASVSTIKDFFVSADGAKFYTVTSSGGVLSLWQKTTSIQRVFSIQTGSNFIVRAAPENADVINFAQLGGQTIYYSPDGGVNTFQVHTAFEPISDLAMESATVTYVLAGTNVSKSLDGFLWDNPLTLTGIGAGSDIVSIAKDNLIVGDTAGLVAYSTNGGVSFTKLTTTALSGGAVRVTADKLSAGGVIYATTVDSTYTSTSQQVNSWVIGTSTSWTTMFDGGVGTGFTPIDIALNSGVLYVLDTNGIATSLCRTLTPASITSTTTNKDKFWSTVSANDSSTAFVATPTGTTFPDNIYVSVGSDKFPKVWTKAAVTSASTGSTSDKIESFLDTLALGGPAPSSPIDKFEDQVNAQTGRTMPIVFSWAAASTATKYDVDIALDSNFSQAKQTFTVGSSATSVQIGPNAAQAYEFQVDTTYYWRVRVSQDGPIYSPFSTTRSFKIGSLVAFAIQSPAKGGYNVPVLPTFTWTPKAGATTYEITVSEDPTFAIIDFSRTSNQTYFQTDEALKYGTTYYWRVRPAGGEYVYGVFTTVGAPPASTTPVPPVTILPPPPTSIQIIQVPTTPAIPNYLLWLIIAIGAILVIALIVLIVRTRRVV